MQISLSKFIFLPLIVLSTYFGLSSMTVFYIWISLELNMISILPLLMSSEKYGSEICLKYFLIQASGSALFLWSFLLTSPGISNLMILSFTMALKIGAAPLHLWLISVLRKSSWDIFFVISTWQKVLPIYLLMMTSFNNLLSIFIATSSMIGSMGAFISQSVKSLLAFSSVFSVSWLLSGVKESTLSWMFYLMSYALVLSGLMILLSSSSSQSVSSVFFVNNSLNKKLAFFIFLLAAGGLPPMLPFWPKVLILSDLLSQSNWVLSNFLMGGTLWILYVYVRLVISSMMMESEVSNLSIKSSDSSSAICIFLSLSLPLAFILPMGVST